MPTKRVLKLHNSMSRLQVALLGACADATSVVSQAPSYRPILETLRVMDEHLQATIAKLKEVDDAVETAKTRLPE